MLIETLVITPFQQNCRILVDPQARVGAVVDPGGDVPLIMEEIDRLGVKIESIILTHSHIDHVGGVEALKRALARRGEQPVVIGHRKEELMRQSIAQQAVMFGLSPDDYENAAEPTRYIDEGDTVQVGRFSAKILFTPGHSPGHVVLFFGELPQGPVLIAGDTLFAGSIGRTDFPMSDHAALIRNIKTKILTLPEETVVMPGHGPDTTVGEEAAHNPYLMVHA